MARKKVGPVAAGEPFVATAAWLVAAASTVLIPLWVSASGREAFRTPKLLLFRGEGIVLAALLVLLALYAPRWFANFRWRGPALVVTAAIAGWSVLVTAVSSDRHLSLRSLLTVIAGAALFLTCYGAARRRGVGVLWLVLIPGIVNAGLAIAQARPAWNERVTRALVGELSVESLARVAPTALLGNRDDLGGFLLTSAIVALALLFSSDRLVLRDVGAAAIIITGLLASKTLTAIAAFVAAVLLMAFLRSWKSGAVAVGATAVLLAGAIIFYPALGERVKGVQEAFRSRNYDRLVVGRLAPILAGVEMTKDHPLFGIGPGLFGKRYYDYKVEIGSRYPALIPRTGWIDYFREAHNDHVETAAKAGLIGYGLFLAALVIGASWSFRSRGSGPQAGVLRFVSLPLFASVFILALAQFPLQLGATLQSLLFTAGILAGWSDHDIDR